MKSIEKQTPARIIALGFMAVILTGSFLLMLPVCVKPGVNLQMCIRDREKIFQMFYTTGYKSADGKRGMGLGLPLCRAILNAHKGTIEVLDHTPSGSIFRITLPAEEVSIHE